jgi:hypothetical protein
MPRPEADAAITSDLPPTPATLQREGSFTIEKGDTTGLPEITQAQRTEEKAPSDSGSADSLEAALQQGKSTAPEAKPRQQLPLEVYSCREHLSLKTLTADHSSVYTENTSRGKA